MCVPAGTPQVFGANGVGSDLVAAAIADDSTEIEDSDVGKFVRTGAGVGVVLGSGLVAALVARRSLGQRRRRAGQPFAAESDAGHAVETQLRHVADPRTVQFVNRALRTLVACRDESDGSLPVLRAARLTDTRLELYLAQPAELRPPFVDLADGAAWSVAADDPGLLGEGRIEDTSAPYPSLVSLGHDSSGALLLVDLEQCGALSLAGPTDLAEAVMTAFAAELATSMWADDLRITLVGCPGWADLDELQTGRIRRVDDVDRLLDELAVRVSDDRDLLDRAGVNDLAQARARQLAESTWTPEILLVGRALSPAQRGRLMTMIEHKPRVAVAAVIGAELDGPSSSTWSFRLEGSLSNPAGVLQPLGVTLLPQLVVPDEYGAVVDQLRSCGLSKAYAERPEPDLRALLVPTVSAAPRAPARAKSTKLETTAPRLLMLGPVRVTNAAELGEPNKLGQLTELAMFISLRPGCDTHAIDEAIWPGSVVTKTTRNTAISKLRRWLGTDLHGVPRLPRTEGRYTFHADLRSDWQQWHELLPNGPGVASTAELHAALTLVRGRPFSGRGRRRYAWVDHDVQEMIVAIVDACHEFAVRSLSEGQPQEARRVSLLGLSIEPGVELLWRDRLKAEMLLGDRDTVLDSIDKLRSAADVLGGDLEDDTEELIEQIMRPGPRL